MKHALLVALVLAGAGASGGCKICEHYGKNQKLADAGCHSGCGPGGCTAGCPDGHCGPQGVPPGGPVSAYGPGAYGPQGYDPMLEGHPDPHEPLYHGNMGPPQRGGLLSAWHKAKAGLGHHDGVPGHAQDAYQPAPGPSAGNVSYPYYTTRGPRDFLAPNPRGIGP